MFVARCEEYAAQIEELNKDKHGAEDEKKTLNQRRIAQTKTFKKCLSSRQVWFL